jgi:hypothetical protein
MDISVVEGEARLVIRTGILDLVNQNNLGVL